MGIPPCGRKSLASTHFEIWVLKAEKISEKSHFGTPGRKTPPVRATLYIGSRLLHQSKEGTEAYNFLCYDFFLRCTPFERQRPEPYRVRTNHVPPPRQPPFRETAPIRPSLHVGSRFLYPTKEDTRGYNFLWYHFFQRRTPSELRALELGRIFQVHLPAGNL